MGKDLKVSPDGSQFVVTPLTPAGLEWIEVFIEEGATALGLNLIVEPRYINDIVKGALEDGLTVEELANG